MQTQEPADLAHLFIEAIPQAMQKIRKEVRGIARAGHCGRAGMTIPQFRILAQLEHGRATQIELADNIGISPPNLSRLLTTLEKLGLVVTERDRVDRRRVFVALTPQGHAEVSALKKKAEAHFQSEISRLSEGEKTALQQGLKILGKIGIAMVLALNFGALSAQPKSAAKVATPEPAPLASSAPLSAITLPQAVDMALEKNPERREIRYRMEAAQSASGVIRAAILPTVNAKGTATQKKDAVFGLGSPKFNGEPYNQYEVKLEGRQPLLQFGLLSSLSANARQVDLSQVADTIAERNLTADVIRTFYRVLLKHRTIEALKNVEALQKESLATAQRRQRIGRGQLLDVLQVKTQLALLAPKLETANVEWKLAAVNLAKLMGDLSAEELRLVGTLEPPPIYAERLEATKKVRLEDLPEFRVAELDVRRVEAEKSALLGKHWPNLAAVGSIGRASYKKNELFDSSTTAWSIGLELNIPLFSGLSSIYERNALSAAVAEKETVRERVRNELVTNQISAQKHLELAEQSAKSSQEAFELANASLNEAKRSFNYATIDFMQFLTVQQAYFEAESSLNQAKFDYIDAAANYYLATGLPIGDLVRKLSEVKAK